MDPRPSGLRTTYTTVARTVLAQSTSLPAKPPVGEDEPDRADQVRREQGGLGTVTVLHARGEHDDHDELAQGVGDDEPLPAVDLHAGVVTTAVASGGVRALDALRVDDPGAGDASALTRMPHARTR
jgi:hypothetical protein